MDGTLGEYRVRVPSGAGVPCGWRAWACITAVAGCGRHWWGTCVAGSSALELQRNAIAFLDTGHSDAARRCNAPDFGYNPIRFSVLSLDLFASQLSISCIVLAVIDIGELFFFFILV